MCPGSKAFCTTFLLISLPHKQPAMKHLLLLSCLFLSAALYAQKYIRDWHHCFDNGERNAPRTPLQALAIDSADNFYTAGFVNLNHDPINDSIYLRKYNTAGALVWEIDEPYKTTSSGAGSALRMAIGRNGNVVLSYSYSFVSSNVDAVVNEYSSAGKKLWQTVFTRPEETDNEQIKKLNIDSKGNIYLLIGEVTSIDYSYGTIAKFSNKGAQLWYRDMKGGYGFLVQDATIDSSGNVYATGFANILTRNEKFNVFTYKFFANGDSAWQKRYISNFSSYGYQVKYARDDNSIVVCGQLADQTGTSDSIIAIKYTVGGRQLWLSNIKPSMPQAFDQSVVDADNNILLASNQAVKYDATFTAPLLTKLSPSGSILWSEYPFAASVSFYPYIAMDLKTDEQSNYYIIVNQAEGILIQKFDKDGNLLAQKTEGLDTSLKVEYAALNIGKKQSIYSSASYSYFYARTNSCISRYAVQKAINPANDELYNDKIALPSIARGINSVYPNPAHNAIYLFLSPVNNANYTIRVFDAIGKQVLTSQGSGSQITLDVSKLSTGLYIISLLQDKEESIYQFIKQ